MLGSHEWWCVNLVADGDEIAEVDIYEIWSRALPLEWQYRQGNSRIGWEFLSRGPRRCGYKSSIYFELYTAREKEVCLSHS